MEAGLQPISIVIPAYNAVGQVEHLLQRLQHFHEKYQESVQVIVADDCSRDGTVAELRRGYPWIDVVANQENRGFGQNVMTGVALARHPYLATINTDVELVGNIFKALIGALEEDKRLFAAMPLVYNRNLDKVENLSRLYCHRGLCWHTELTVEEEWSSIVRDLMSGAADMKSRLRDIAHNARPINSVLCGAAFVCRRDRFLELGGFDPRFSPFYWEDVDLDYRARRRGWRCATVPSAAVIHRHSETIDKYQKARKLRYLRLNQLRFVMEHQRALRQEGLKMPHLWWGARAVKEVFGDPVLRSAYLWAGIGVRQV